MLPSSIKGSSRMQAHRDGFRDVGGNNNVRNRASMRFKCSCLRSSFMNSTVKELLRFVCFCHSYYTNKICTIFDPDDT